jgi:hypothetical protein
VKPTTIMMVSFGLIVVSHWANKEPTLSVKLIVEMVFVILVMGMMEGSENTSDIATLFAYLFLAATVLSKTGTVFFSALKKVTA